MPRKAQFSGRANCNCHLRLLERLLLRRLERLLLTRLLERIRDLRPYRRLEGRLRRRLSRFRPCPVTSRMRAKSSLEGSGLTRGPKLITAICDSVGSLRSMSSATPSTNRCAKNLETWWLDSQVDSSGLLFVTFHALAPATAKGDGTPCCEVASSRLGTGSPQPLPTPNASPHALPTSLELCASEVLAAAASAVAVGWLCPCSAGGGDASCCCGLFPCVVLLLPSSARSALLAGSTAITVAKTASEPMAPLTLSQVSTSAAVFTGASEETAFGDFAGGALLCIHKCEL